MIEEKNNKSTDLSKQINNLTFKTWNHFLSCIINKSQTQTQLALHHSNFKISSLS